MSVTPSLQDFSLIRTYVDKFRDENTLQTPSLGFSFFVLDLLLNLQSDEIEDALTDSFYLQSRSLQTGHDRGIDALYIDNSESPSTVHLFNFKYTDEFRRTANHFPATEIDKMLGFLSSIMAQDESLSSDINPVLYSKAQEIWSLFQTESPRFVFHICANYYQGFEEAERRRFERELGKYTGISVEYHLMQGIVERLTHRGRQVVNARIKAIDKHLFEKSGGDIRALIVEFDARDLIRIVVDDADLRNKVDLEDYLPLKGRQLLDDAFEDNVRIYLKQRSRINQNIKTTALGDDSHRFFFFNNGITLTCSRFEYPRNQRGPIVELENIQVVNGGQTLHALFEAFQENPEKFEEIEILCRIYETGNQALSTNIAEFTNSQNPVKSRDIRSNDYMQKKLERELLAKDYYYERKKGQYQDKPRSKRIDAERAGQVLMAFFNEMPSEAKDNKRLIFAEKYDAVFSDSVNADALLLCLGLFGAIERERKRKLAEIMVNPDRYDSESFIMHASFYLLYLLRKLGEVKNIELDLSNRERLFALYEDALQLIVRTIEMEKELLKKKKESYGHRVFFKGNRPKKHLESLLLTWPDMPSNVV